MSSTMANLDVLELIVALLDRTDLVAAALVSRTFLAAALPALYASIEYSVHHAKRAATLMSPFATLVAHNNLVVHVKRITIHAAPSFGNSQVNPAFLFDLARALGTATNLRAFVCTANILPPLLPHLIDKHRLHHLRIFASLGSRQLAVLRNKSGLHSLCLDSPSWNVIDALPSWSASMQRTLAHLTLFMSQEIDPTVLNATLAQLPRLHGLHVIGCPRITHNDVLNALLHTPDLLELSLTVFPSLEMLPQLNFSIPPLTHLSIDIRTSCYPILKSLLARIISRLSPRVALAICGGWIGEIKGSTEHTDPPPDAASPSGSPTAGAGGNGGNQNFHVWQGHVHLHGNDLPLLSPPHPHHEHSNHTPPSANQNNNPPPLYFFGFPAGNPNGNSSNSNDDNPPGADPPNPPGPVPHPDPDTPLLIPSFPSTLSVVHLPLISPAALREVVDRCEGIQVLGVIIGASFVSKTSVKPSGTTGRSTARSAARFKHTSVAGITSEINLLSNILSRARELRELIIDTSSTDIINSADPRADGPHGASSTMLLTPLAVRSLMRESPLLRRIVGEGRIWESPTPTPSSPVPFPHALTIDLTLSKARYGPGSNHHRMYGPPGFGAAGGSQTQVETDGSHWFWLRGSASGGKGYGGS